MNNKWWLPLVCSLFSLILFLQDLPTTAVNEAINHWSRQLLIPLGLDQAGWGGWGMFMDPPRYDIYKRVAYQSADHRFNVKQLITPTADYLPNARREWYMRFDLGDPSDLYKNSFLRYQCQHSDLATPPQTATLQVALVPIDAKLADTIQAQEVHYNNEWKVTCQP